MNIGPTSPLGIDPISISTPIKSTTTPAMIRPIQSPLFLTSVLTLRVTGRRGPKARGYPKATLLGGPVHAGVRAR